MAKLKSIGIGIWAGGVLLLAGCGGVETADELAMRSPLTLNLRGSSMVCRQATFVIPLCGISLRHNLAIPL